MRQRSETFYLRISEPFAELYLPKQGALKVRPVKRVVVYVRNQSSRDADFNRPILDATSLPNLTLTLRDAAGRELMTDVPAWMFGENVQFAKPGPGGAIMHARRQLNDLLIDPQKTSARWNSLLVPPLGTENLCIEFVYA
jgi:hypothetical protein